MGEEIRGPSTSLGMTNLSGRRIQALFLTLPLRMHRVQTRILRTLPPISARTSCRLWFQRRLVLLLAWLTLFPTEGCFLQYAQCLIGLLTNSLD